MIKASVAVSSDKDAFAAGRDAGQRAMAELGCEADMVWVFGAVGYDQSQLLAGISSVLGQTPLVGCSTDGEISTEGLSMDSVVVLALGSDTVRFHVTCVENLSKDSHGAGVEVGRRFSHLSCHYLQVFSAGLTGNAVQIIEGLKSVLGDGILIAGGAAGDGGAFKKTYQYFNGEVMQDCLVAVAFEGEFTVGTGVGCGWFPVGTPKKVTRSQGNILYELDGVPALSVYEKFLGKYASQLPAVGVEYPLGLIDSLAGDDPEDFFLCRATMGVDHESQSIQFAGEIPEGAMVKMTMGNENDLLGAARKAATDALANLKSRGADAEPKVVFVYSCMARKIVLGSRAREEIEEIQKIIGRDIPLIGFYSYGEYAPAGKRYESCFHNETVTMSILSG